MARNDKFLDLSSKIALAVTKNAPNVETSKVKRRETKVVLFNLTNLRFLENTSQRGIKQTRI